MKSDIVDTNFSNIAFPLIWYQIDGVNECGKCVQISSDASRFFLISTNLNE